MVAAGGAGATGAAECPAHHPRHHPGRSARQLRLRRRADAAPRPARGRGHPLRPRRVAGAADLAGARQPDDRPQSLRARRPQQRPLRAGRRRADAGRTVHGGGLRHCRLRQLVRARPAVRPGPRLCHLRRRARSAARVADSLELERRGDRTVAAASAWLAARTPAPAGRTSCGSISTTPTIPTRRRPTIAPPSRAVPTTARSPSRTRWSASCWPAPATAPPPDRRWSSLPPTTARAWANTAKARTGSSSTTAPSAFRSSCRGQGCSPNASSIPSSDSSTWRRRWPRWLASRRSRASTAGASCRSSTPPTRTRRRPPTPRPTSRSSSWAGRRCVRCATAAGSSSTRRSPNSTTSPQTLESGPTSTRPNRPRPGHCGGSSRRWPALPTAPVRRR